jgi:hypothetical protein
VVIGMRDADLYQPETNRFSRAGRTNVARLQNTADLLPDGEVLIAGGIDERSYVTASAEFYSPTQHRFLMLPEPVAGTE